jgi:UDP-N-acetylmuramyl tripeptide synthase
LSKPASRAAKAIRMLDSRRLTGPSLLMDVPGAILDAELAGVDASGFIQDWTMALLPMLEGLGWPLEAAGARPYKGGVSLAFAAPIDQLYVATEVNEWAFASAAQANDVGEAAEFAAELARLREVAAAERRPALLALAAEASRRGVPMLCDDDHVSLGLGTGSRSWPVGELPAPADVPWAQLHAIPVALVTGTNGKTTTVRLMGAIAREAGVVAGLTSTDFIEVGGQVIEEGDFSGPAGARTVLRDARVALGILEVARGGILRRGLPVTRAEVAVVTNVANDHLGEYGILDTHALAQAKLVVAKAIDEHGRVVLNADDALLLEAGRALQQPVAWFTRDADQPHVRAHREAGGDAAWVQDDAFMLQRGGVVTRIAGVAEVPLTFDGAAHHNVENAMAALLASSVLGASAPAIRAGLTGFASTPESNPGRANTWRLGGLTAIVDFAHNPHGLAALANMVALLPAKRRGLVIGQAGDRDDASIREFARASWTMHPDRVFVKEMEIYLRGREKGVVPELLLDELRAIGAQDSQLERFDDELAAVRAALAWAQEGDLLLLTTHAERDGVTALLRALQTGGWRPGMALV